MVKMFKRLNVIQIISFILLIIAFILLIFNVNNSDNLFWVCFSLNMLGYALFIIKWTKEGKTWYKNLDKNYGKNLTRKPSEILFFLLVIYYIIICAVFIIEIWIKDFSKQFSTMIILFILAIIFNYISIIIVNKTYKEVKTLINPKK